MRKIGGCFSVFIFSRPVYFGWVTRDKAKNGDYRWKKMKLCAPLVNVNKCFHSESNQGSLFWRRSIGTSNVDVFFIAAALTSVLESPKRCTASACSLLQFLSSKLEKKRTESLFYCGRGRIFRAPSATARWTKPTPASPNIQKRGTFAAKSRQGDIKPNL